MKKLLQSLCFVLFFAASAFAQDKTVTGTVVSKEDGLPLPGVSVLAKGTKVGTVTNSDGKFNFKVPANTTSLELTFIGYKPQSVPIPSSNVVNVSMNTDAQELAQVVVTALGITRKKNELPYSAQEVKAEEITRTRDNNLVNSLGGKVAGLDIKRSNAMGGSTNVVIRGFKSISGNNQALFIVDGVPVSNANTNTANQQAGRAGYDFGNAAADINPDDVASMTVLKGAAATALYGSRAANGVIIITTKKGRKGSTNITVNSGLSFGKIDKSTFAKYQKEYGAGYSSPGTDGTGNPVPVPGFWYRDIFGTGTKEMTPQFSSDASYGPRFDPNLLVYQWSSLDPFSPNYKQKTPWVAGANGPETFYETAVVSNQSVSVDGGGENGTFKIGYTRNDENGVLPNSKITKNLFNFGAGYQIAKDLMVNASANYSKIDGLGRYGTGYSGLNPNQGFRQWWQTNADISELKDAYFRNQKNVSWNWSDTKATNPIYADNPYFNRYKNYVNDTRDHYFGNISLSYKVNSWFDVVGRISYDGTYDLQEERIAVGSVAVPSYARTNRTYGETNYDLLLNFNKNISEDISFKGLLGANLRRDKLTSIRAQTNGGLVVPEFYALSNSVSPIEAPQELYARRAVDGHFASATFGYKDYLFLDATIRRDLSTTLPAANNVFWYPSVAASFAFSNLLKEQTWLSYGKLRLNYAEVGADAPALSVYDTYTKPTAFGSVPMFSISNTKNNQNLRPERTKSIEAGLDAAFLNERVGFDLTLYKTKTVDQITPVTVSSSSGYSQLYVNAGEVENKGIEASVFGVPIKTKDFSWRLNVNFTVNRNKVLSLYEGAGGNIELASLQGGVTLNAAVGKPYGIIRGTNYVYINGQPVVGANGYYKATSSSAEIIGDPNPDFLAGIGNTFHYKNVSLNFLVDIRKGGSLFSLDQWYGLGTGMYPETAGLNDLGNPKRNTLANGGGIILPGVKEDGSPNDKRVDVSTSGGSAYGYSNNPPRASTVYDASYVKLREVSLTYSLPEKWIQKIHPFRGIDVSLLGRNLWIIHKNVPYADPEDGLSSGNLVGYQSGAYPAVRTIGFNVKFKL
ncbi:SusC/RagA family TonB-linked outer membrane protein [Pedobacter punctiformis]|uniref:SusC/RagA family TonB-linked outer membrane protein n=1 Tax=Pedobacter punctiformis TaxID=3004097 RepID=A0ABT4LA29_9SPHI|nr:SusC/RagA family TonB-linked outer membrane protein [Pedobacter sp. HCMS5-2]MCZ4244547.1 SusC/RagA family TonB-linked outer membrane protein [Pedobacter sp. HCMS5-2]